MLDKEHHGQIEKCNADGGERERIAVDEEMLDKELVRG